MKHLILILSFLCLAGAVAAQQQQQADSTPPAQGWVQLTSGTTAGLSHISLVGPDTVYASGDALLRSTDAGTTWEVLMNAPYHSGQLLFTDDTTGFLFSGGDTVYRTTNGGAGWQAVPTKMYPNRPVAIEFATHDSGWAIAGNFARTTNAGAEWDPQQGLIYANCMAIANSKVGFIMGNSGYTPNPHYPPSAYFARMTDGWSWNYVYAGWGPGYTMGPNKGIIQKDVFGITVISADTIIAVGSEGLVARSMDSGNTWTDSPPLTTYDGYSAVTFPDHTHGTAVGTGGWIIHSTDGGVTWQRQNSGVLGGLGGVAFVNDSIGYASGANGVVIKTTNGGLSWVLVTPMSFNIIQGSVYPQPADQNVSITYNLPETQHITLSIQNIAGANVSNVLVGQLQSAGIQTASFDTSTLDSGTYTYVLQTEKYSATGKIQVIH